MKKKNDLQRAVILSLIVSGTIVGNAWAKDLNAEHILKPNFPEQGETIYGIYDGKYFDSIQNKYVDYGKTDYDNIYVTVKNNYSPKDTHPEPMAIGISVSENLSEPLELNAKNNIIVDVTTVNGHPAEGVFGRYGKTISLTAGNDIIISAKKTDLDKNDFGGKEPEYQTSDVWGVEIHESTVNVNAGNNIKITADYDREAAIENSGVGKGTMYGISSYKGQGSFTAGESITVKASTKDGWAYGIYVNNININDDKIESESGKDAFLRLNSKFNYIEATRDGSGMVWGIFAANGAKVDITGYTYVHGDDYGIHITGQNSSLNERDDIQFVVKGDVVASAENGKAIILDSAASMKVDGSEGLVGRGLQMSGNSEKWITGSLYTWGSVQGTAVELSDSRLTVGDDVRVVSEDSTGVSVKDSDFSAGGNVSIFGKNIGLQIENSKDNIVELGKDGSINFIIGDEAALDLKGSLNIKGNTYFQSDLKNADSAAVKISGVSEFTAGGPVTALGGLQGFKVETGGRVDIDGGSGVNFFKANAAREDVSSVTDTAFGNAVNVAKGASFSAGGSGNILQAGKLEDGIIYNDPENIDDNETALHGSETAISSIGGKAELTADGLFNYIQGAVYAAAESEVDIIAKNGADNIILASTHGRASSSNEDNGEHLVSAVYATGKSDIAIDAGMDGKNIISSDFKMGTGDDYHENDREITVWAEDGGSVNIKGAVNISSSNNSHYTVGEDGKETKGNSLGIAVSAGGRTLEFVDGKPENGLADVENISKVNIDYASNIRESSIIGDIVAGYGGEINIGQNLISLLNGQTISGGGESCLSIKGNLLSANGGVLNADLGSGGVWIGRADDYGDAGYGSDASNHENFYNPAFSNDIMAGGEVNVKMGQDSLWALTGQSWVTSMEANGSVIDMAGATIDGNEALDSEHNHALVIGEFKGSGSTFIMDLDAGKLAESDMLYIKDNQGSFDVQLKDAINEEELAALGEEGLRFATIHGNTDGITVGADGQTRATYSGSGFSNVTYTVEEREYHDNDDNNDIYNNGDNTGEDNSFDHGKPGSGFVEDSFDEGDTNLVITGVAERETGDVGETIVNMSRANYSNAVYMDRLNKRMGEARFIDGDEGLWVRLRHDRIGKEDAFRSQNTMYEMGYDVKQANDGGERRVGIALDYMDGQTEYTNIGGQGEIKRQGLWVYDTWLGDKGHYTDFVAKWGHLYNDFDITAPDGTGVQGDYSNNVFSLSAEYGKKNDMGGNWYFEPQMQLQYAHVTGADYATSAGTAVSVGSIDSLIARAGFRIGKDVNDSSTFYIKGDIMHEFMGDQEVYALDDSTGVSGVREKYDNGGTWYDLGLGFAAKVNKASYAYLDVERSFGNDNDETYQINAGMQWSF